MSGMCTHIHSNQYSLIMNYVTLVIYNRYILASVSNSPAMGLSVDGWMGELSMITVPVRSGRRHYHVMFGGMYHART